MFFFSGLQGFFPGCFFFRCYKKATRLHLNSKQIFYFRQAICMSRDIELVVVEQVVECPVVVYPVTSVSEVSDASLADKRMSGKAHSSRKQLTYLHTKMSDWRRYLSGQKQRSTLPHIQRSVTEVAAVLPAHEKSRRSFERNDSGNFSG